MAQNSYPGFNTEPFFEFLSKKVPHAYKFLVPALVTVALGDCRTSDILMMCPFCNYDDGEFFFQPSNGL